MDFIKTILCISLALLHFQVSAQSIEASLHNGTQLDCSSSTSLPAACIGPDGSRYLIRANSRFATGISLSLDGAFNTFVMIKNVKLDDQIIYESLPLPESMNFSAGYPSPKSTFKSDLILYSSILSNLNYTGSNITDPSALALLTQMKAEATAKAEEAQRFASPKNIEIELEDGSKGTCENIDSVFKPIFSCSIYRCNQPSKSFYIDGEFGASTIIRLNEDHKIQGSDIVSAVWNPLNRDKPIMQELPIIPFDRSGMYGTSEKYAQQIKKMRKQVQRQQPTLESQNPEVLLSFNDPMYRSLLSSFIKTCDANQVAPLVNGLKDLRQQIADAEMVQLVEVTNNVLTSRLINPDSIPDNTCRDGETWYRGQSYDLSRDILVLATPKTIDLKTANRLFNEARAMTDIAWNYKADGCYARAHLMARRFEEQGIHVDKVWIKGDLRVPEADIEWNFHVAPIVYVEDDNGQVQKMVIDPSLMDGPVPVDEWSAKMEKGVVGKTIESQFPFPGNAMNLERTAIAFSNSEPYLPYDQITMSEETKMAESASTMRLYLRFSK